MTQRVRRIWPPTEEERAQIRHFNRSYNIFAQEYRQERHRLDRMWIWDSPIGFLECSNAWDAMTNVERQPYLQRGEILGNQQHAPFAAVLVAAQQQQQQHYVIGHGIVAARVDDNRARMEGRHGMFMQRVVLPRPMRRRRGGVGVRRRGEQDDGVLSGRGPLHIPPSRPLTSYIIFCNTTRPEIMHNGDVRGIGGMGRELGRRWRALDQNERRRYQLLGLEEMRRYRREMTEFRSLQNDARQQRRGRI